MENFIQMYDLLTRYYPNEISCDDFRGTFLPCVPLNLIDFTLQKSILGVALLGQIPCSHSKILL